MDESRVTEGVVVRPLDPAGEWYEVPRDLLIHFRGVPGFEATDDGYRIHRTHLPLLPQEIRDGVGNGGTFDMRSAALLDSQTEPLGWRLRPYQHAGREFIRARRGTLLADQQRLGKTPTIIASHDPRDGQLVVIGPLASRGVWTRWMKARWPNVKPAVVKGKTLDYRVLKSSPCVFMHYDVSGSWQSSGYLDVGTVAFDEAQALSNRRSDRTQAAILMAGQAKRVIMSTGTPIWNRPEGLHTMLQLLGPGGWGNYVKFTRRYCAGAPTAYGWKAKGSSNEEEFQRRLTEVMIRRLWKEVGQDLPETQRDADLVPVDLDSSAHLDKLLASLQSSDTPTTIGEMARLRRLLGRLKLTRAVELADAWDGPVVLWVWHQEVMRELRQELDAFTISGEDDPECRDEILELWRKTTKPLIMSLAVGQTAIDLSHASRAIFVELDWTPAVVSQAEMRTFSPLRPMSITYLVADHEIDLLITKALMSKVDLASKLGLPAAETAIDLLKECLGEDFDFGDDDPVDWFFS